MTRRPAPLPEQLRGRAFRRDEAPELAAGRLRRLDLWSPARGVRLPAGDTQALDILRARQLLIPAGGAYSHTSAARAHGGPVPLDRDGVTTVHITTPPDIRRRRGKTVSGHSRPLGAEDVAIVNGVRCTRLFRTFCDLEEVLTFAELVAFGDWMIGRGKTGATVKRLTEALAATRLTARRREVLSTVIARLNAAAESPKESELRILLEDAGLGPFVLQLEIRDEHGRFVARPDLTLPALKIAIEYDGDYHRDPIQWRKDQARRRRLEALGWTYIVVTQVDLADPAALLADVRTAIRARS
ncbi:hypothetical protein ACH0AH_08595 [Microbacterium paludicola]|uniref:hypothetical protein n=1 Tax=Microbacterium paludicola TaxID=300019 RepID=UPI00387A1C77